MSSFRKAVRTARKGRISIQGPAGSGKTRTALELLTRIAKRVAVIDTEHSSADTYAPLPGEAAQPDHPTNATFDFDNCPMEPPYTPAAYMAKIAEAAREGYDGLIIDSLSHAWMGDGGILSMADKKGGRFDAWKELTPIQNKLMTAVLSFPGHIIVTMRTQTAYEVTKDERTGKNKPEKIGTKPVQKEGTEYEFDIVIDIDPEHVGHVTKTRCSEIEGLSIQRPGAPLALTIKRWLDAGEVPEPLAPKAPIAPPSPPAAPVRTTPQQIAARFVSQIIDEAKKRDVEALAKTEIDKILVGSTALELSDEEARAAVGTKEAFGPLPKLRDAIIAGRLLARPEQAESAIPLTTVRTALFGRINAVRERLRHLGAQAKSDAIVDGRKLDQLDDATLRGVADALGDLEQEIKDAAGAAA